MTKPLLTVCLITYNHAKYINSAIDGVLMQKVNFTWEIIIADDFSTDGTREILLEYKNKYPSKIKLILQEKNVGPSLNWIKLITTPNSKYIAYFEGDDFWIDPYKLQKQVDFMELNPDYSLCFHDALVYWENKTKLPYYFCKIKTNTSYDVEDIIKDWLMPSASIVYRNDLLHPLPQWFNEVYNGDYALQLILILKGKFYYINQIMSVYRQTGTNLSATVNATKINQSLNKLLHLYNSFTNFKYNTQIINRIDKLNNSLRIIKVKNIFLKIPFGKNI